MQGKIELSEVVDQLRLELQVLNNEVKDKQLQFLVESVEVELRVAVTKESTVGAKAKFWVLEVGAEGKHNEAVTQVIKLKLIPNAETLIGR